MKARHRHAPEPAAEDSGTKVRCSFYLPADLMESCRDAVVALAGPPHQLTLGRLAEDALRLHLRHLQRQANSGKPFPPRRAALRVGRPIR